MKRPSIYVNVEAAHSSRRCGTVAFMSDRLDVLGSAVLLLVVALACKAGSSSSTSSSAAATTASAPAAPAAKPTEVAFVQAVPKPGAKADQSMKTAMKFTLAGTAYRTETESVASIEVQASDEFRVTKAAIDVTTLVETSQKGTSPERRTVNPIQGSRWVLSRSDGGGFAALTSAGSPASSSMLAQLKEHFGDVVEKDKSLSFLPNHPVKIGEKIIPSQDAVLAMLGQKDDGKTTIDGVELILRSADANEATFDTSLTFTMKVDAATRLRAKLAGTIGVRPTNAIVTAVSLKGPLTILDGGGDEKGSGDMNVTGALTMK